MSELSGERSSQVPDIKVFFRVFWRIGLLSFGGPAAQIALMHRELVDRRQWLTESQYLNALSFCMLLPGPEAMQLATYAGWRLRGMTGGLIAGSLFVLPGAVLIFVLGALYAYWGELPLMSVLFSGVKAAVLIIVIEALLRLSKKALREPVHWLIALCAFVGIFFLSLPFPVIIAMAALFGAVRSANTEQQAPVALAPGAGLSALAVIAAGAVLWFLPVIAVASWLDAEVLNDISLFFAKLAVVTFGGAYAVLGYMAQDVVNHHGWLSAGEMLDGLGLAETTPGPLILVTQFVGFLAGFREGGLILGFAAGLLTLWVTFVPCFVWIFAGAPYIEWVCAQPRLKAALQAITAAVVGVIVHLSVWFGLHVLFQTVTHVDSGPITLWLPVWESIDWRVTGIAALSALLLLRLHWNIALVLFIAAGSAGVISLFQ